MINWKVRTRNRNFWLAAIPAALLLVQAVLACFGITWDYTQVSQELLGVVNALFALLAIIGIVADPTTAGIGDSAQALTYSTPKPTESAVAGKKDAGQVAQAIQSAIDAKAETATAPAATASADATAGPMPTTKE